MALLMKPDPFTTDFDRLFNTLFDRSQAAQRWVPAMDLVEGEDHFLLRADLPGLSEDDLSKAFTKYAKLSNKPTGGETSSGLGLAICKQMIDLHRGKIGVFNNPERGATFWFSIPLS